jgi:ABC-type branched-subunit amino acid transport system ATPase component
MNDDSLLEFQAVTKRFPGVVALDDVSFEIRRGEIHGIRGENGAGKSTLMKILSVVYSHGTYEGKIIFNGEEVNLGAGSICEAAEKGISIVYQELTLIPTMTVGENVFLGREPVEHRAINWMRLPGNGLKRRDRELYSGRNLHAGRRGYRAWRHDRRPHYRQPVHRPADNKRGPARQYVLKAIVLVLAVLVDVYFKKSR